MQSTALAYTEPGSHVVILGGELGAHTLHALREQLRAIDERCEIDLTKVLAIDGAAMTELVTLARRLGPHAVTLRGASRQFVRILELVGLTHLFRIEA